MTVHAWFAIPMVQEAHAIPKLITGDNCGTMAWHWKKTDPGPVAYQSLALAPLLGPQIKHFDSGSQVTVTTRRHLEIISQSFFS